MNSLEFSDAVRRLTAAAREAGGTAPSFRSRPCGANRRTIRRRPDGSATVAVSLRDRPFAAVLGDLIDGVVVANQLTGAEASDLRDRLWRSVTPLLVDTPHTVTSSVPMVALAA